MKVITETNWLHMQNFFCTFFRYLQDFARS